MQYDRNGVHVRNTQPVRQIRKATRQVTVDSRDRDVTKYQMVVGGATVSDPGDYVVSLPRVFTNVTRIRLKSAIIRAPNAGFRAEDMYVLLSLENLNRMDETAPGAMGSGLADSTFAKIVNDTGYSNLGVSIASASAATSGGVTTITYTTSTNHPFAVGNIVSINGLSIATFNQRYAIVSGVPSTTSFTVIQPSWQTAASGTPTATGATAIVPGMLVYNNNSYDDNVTDYNPPIGKLDRLHITLRRHTDLASVIPNTITNPPNPVPNAPLTAPITFGNGENSFVFEIEYLENGFDPVSAYETQLNAVNYVR